MEHQNQEQETFLKLCPHNFERFAEADNMLRAGMHIQNHKSQKRFFDFVEDNIDTLTEYYDKLYKIKLTPHVTVDNKFYFLDCSDMQNSKLKKEKLDSQATLFAIFLYYLHKVEKQFSYFLTKQEILEVLNTNPKIKPHIQKLFFGKEKEDTSSVQKSLDSWISNSLRQLEKLGWVYFPDDDEKFELLPAFERIALIYNETIYNIDDIKTSYEYQNQ